MTQHKWSTIHSDFQNPNEQWENKKIQPLQKTQNILFINTRFDTWCHHQVDRNTDRH